MKLSVTRADGQAIAVEAETLEQVEQLFALVVPPSPPDTEPPEPAPPPFDPSAMSDLVRKNTDLMREVEHLRSRTNAQRQALAAARREVIEGTDLAAVIDHALRI